MRRLRLLLCLMCLVFAENKEQNQVLDCNLIFESRKEEIAAQLKQLEEQQQTLMILQNATENVLKEREEKVKQQEQGIAERQKQFQEEQKKFQEDQARREEERQKEFQKREEEIKKLIARNEEILKEIKGEKKNKLVETYAKMKDSKAAEILQSLPTQDALEILSAMDSKLMGKILGKMNPAKAAEITLAFQNAGNTNQDNNQ